MYEVLNMLVNEAKEGNMESKAKLLETLKPLIISSIRKYYNKPKEYEDLLQEGRVLVLECLNSYEETKGTYFLGYVKHMLMYYYLDKNKKKESLSLNEKVGDEEEEELIDLLESDDKSALDRIIQFEEYKELANAILNLSRKQRQIILDFYFRKMKIDEIAVKRKISYRTVVNTRSNAIRKIRQYLDIGRF